MEVSFGVVFHPVPVDLLELELVRGRGVDRQISLLPLPVFRLKRWSLPPRRSALLVSVQGGGGYVFPLCVPMSSPPLFVCATLFPSPPPSVTLIVPDLSAARHVESEAQCWCTDPDIGMTRRCN